MFLRLVLFVMIFSVVFARNLEHNDDRVPCSEEDPSNHHRHEMKPAVALLDKNSASPLINSNANKDEHHYPLKMHVKKRAATAHESQAPAPKPGCCG